MKSVSFFQKIALSIILGSLFLTLGNNSLSNLRSINKDSEALIIEEETELIVNWEERFGGNFEITGKSLVKSNAGGYVFSGWTNGSGAGDFDVLVLATDDLGNEIWNTTIGNVEEDKGYQIIKCSSGGYIVAATYTNTSAAITNQDFMLTKLANDGTVVWSKYFSGPEQTGGTYIGDLGRSVFECTNGDFILGGVTQGPTPGADIWMLRVTVNGHKVWERTYQHWDTDRCYTPHSILECTGGGLAILGYTYQASDTNDVWLIRTNANGMPLWNVTFGDDVGYQRPEGFVQCVDEGFAIIANTHSFGAGGSDAWVIRTDKFGNHLWNKTYGGSYEDNGFYIQEMSDGGFTVSGTTHSFGEGNGDGWIIRTDNLGEIEWNHTIGDPYGNSAGAFVYEGNDVYTILGKSISLGENFGKVWLYQIAINEITQTPTPTPTPTPTITPTNTTTQTTEETRLDNLSLITFSLPIFVIITVRMRKKKR